MQLGGVYGVGAIRGSLCGNSARFYRTMKGGLAFPNGLCGLAQGVTHGVPQRFMPGVTERSSRGMLISSLLPAP